jgi:8-oxo-dGTP diphosphatase
MRQPSFYLTADTLLVVGNEVMLVQRKHDPFVGQWGLPGGFVEPDERIPDAAKRELQEETGVAGIELQQFGTYGDPGRDPRGRTVSVVYWQRLAQKPPCVAGDDAADCRWFPIDQLPRLAFDHSRILEDARKRLHELATR